MDIGRPLLLDEMKRREIVAVLSMGGTREMAANYVGCHPTTIWRTANRLPEFAAAMTRAESNHEMQHLGHVSSAAKDVRHWRAAAWTLEHCYPDRYARRRSSAITLEQMSQILSQLAGLILEEIPEQTYCQRILDRLGQLSDELQSAGPQGAAL